MAINRNLFDRGNDRITCRIIVHPVLRDERSTSTSHLEETEPF
ncbi:MmpS family transport accessory protein [Exiguobacterium sp. s48]